MKVCPKCGYIEHEYWRQNRWRTNVEFTHTPEFKINYPKLAMDLEVLYLKKGKKAVVTDRFYTYKFGGKNNEVVERILIQEYNAAGEQAFHIPREKSKIRSRDLNQRRLLEVVNSSE